MVFNVQLKTWQARGALAMPGLKHERVSMTPCSCQQRMSRPATLSVLGEDLAIVFALGHRENGRVCADSARAATVRAAQAPARPCTMECLEVTSNPQANR